MVFKPMVVSGVEHFNNKNEVFYCFKRGVLQINFYLP